MTDGKPGAERPGSGELESVTADLKWQALDLRSEIAACEESETLLRADCDLDAADAATKRNSLDQVRTDMRRARLLLARTESTLVRLSDGSFGTCTRCSVPIGRERLMAMPTAELCLDCQALGERTGHPDGG